MQYKRIGIFGGGIVILFLARAIFTHSWSYGFIIMNIFLAAVPLLLEYSFLFVGHRVVRKFRKLLQLAFGVSWLLFLPNAFYIITDFMHLNPDVIVNLREDGYRHVLSYSRGDALYMFDSLLLLLATIFGAYVGGVALVHGYAYLRKHLSFNHSNAAFALILLLSAVGVYIGRFSRWNSWDGITHPYEILMEIVNDLTNPIKRGRLIIVIVTVLIIEVVSFAYVQYSTKTSRSISYK